MRILARGPSALPPTCSFAPRFGSYQGGRGKGSVLGAGSKQSGKQLVFIPEAPVTSAGTDLWQ